jgi:biotin carboxyl carrier protein
METEIKIGGKVYQIEISEIQEGFLKVRINENDYFFSQNEFGEIVPIEKENLLSLKSFKREEVLLESLGEKEIKSPIAGLISSIDVKEGEEVKPGKKVATLMAMKMENEIVSESYGKVKKIKVRSNQSVNAGSVLIILD